MVTTVQRNTGGRGGNQHRWGESNAANSAVEIGRTGRGFAHTVELGVPQDETACKMRIFITQFLTTECHCKITHILPYSK